MLEHALDTVQETVQAVAVVAVVRVRTRSHVVVGAEVLRAVRMLGGVGARGGGRVLGEAGRETQFAEAGLDFLAEVDGLGFRGSHLAHHVGYDAAEEGGAVLAAVADGGRAQRQARDGELHVLVSV